MWGALYVVGVCLLPEFMFSKGGVPFQFGGTSLMIVVVVAMDFMAQLQAQMMSHQYGNLLNKANPAWHRTGMMAKARVKRNAK